MQTKLKIYLLPIVLLLITVLLSCTEKSAGGEIAVIVPLSLEGQPETDALVKAVRAFAKKHGMAVLNETAGSRQEWADKVKLFAGKNPSAAVISYSPPAYGILKEICTDYPDLFFLVFDSDPEDKNPPPNMVSIIYDRLQQGFLTGYLAALITEKNAGESAALISGPLNKNTRSYLFSGIEIGIHTVNPDISLEISEIPGWNDRLTSGRKAADFFNSGTDVIIAYAGKADEGIISTAEEYGKYVLAMYPENNEVSAEISFMVNDMVNYYLDSHIKNNLSGGSFYKANIENGYLKLLPVNKKYRKKFSSGVIDEIRKVEKAFRNNSLDISAAE